MGREIVGSRREEIRRRPAVVERRERAVNVSVADPVVLNLHRQTWSKMYFREEVGRKTPKGKYNVVQQES